MSEREWQRGDVAMVTARWIRTDDHSERYAVRVSVGWTSRAGVHVSDWEVSEVRPLAVIDYEDREQVERLVRAHCDYFDHRGPVQPEEVTAMQAALREFANPTPEEPTNPKARVTDRRENIWRLLADGDWVCTSGPDCGEYLVWWQLAERGPLTIEATP